MENNNNEILYFAAKPAEECASVLLEKSKTFFRRLETNAYIDKIQRMWRAYHGTFGGNLDAGHQVEFTGEQGEIVQLPVNHFRNLARITYNMVTATRPAMQARAMNTDYKSLSQTYLANGILEYYMREKHLEYHLKKAVEMAIVLGSGFIKMEWNATAGDPFDIDDETGQIINNGDIVFTNLSPLDVVVDGTKETWDNDWILVRTYQNKYNLIAKYPELKEKILGLQTKNQSLNNKHIFSNDDTDDVPIYEMFHRKTDSLQKGRYLLFASADCVFLDTDLPYPDIPVFRIVPSEILGTPYGYTDMYDIFPIQEMINSCYSTISTNINAFGVQSVFFPRDGDLTIASIDSGMQIIEGNAPPQPINLTQTPAEVYEFLQILIQSAETISGINSVARGNPESSLKSGTALALVQSMALQYISGLQQSYVKLVEDLGTNIIKFLQVFGSAPRVAAIVGKNNRSYLKEYSGNDISKINRVYVDLGNPLSQSTAGRVQMAQELLQMGAIKNPNQYLQIINTGKLDSAIENDEHQLLLMKDENEKLMGGEVPLVSPMDLHKSHILEHSSVLSDPEIRKNADFVKKVMDHIQMHMDALRNVDPDLLSMIGEVALPPVQVPPPLGDMGQPGMPPPSGEILGKTNEILEPQQGFPESGDIISGPGIEAGNILPEMPTPPPPFENLPIDPSQLPLK